MFTKLFKTKLFNPKPSKHFPIIARSMYSKMNTLEIDDMDDHGFEFQYPIEFESFCVENDLKPPRLQSGNGKALSAMIQYPTKYWDRTACDAFVKKYNIPTKDSIQLFNKHSQWGIRTNSDDHVKGKLYIVQPFSLSNKHKMRKSFKFDGTQQEKYSEIDRIKSTIQEDYIHIPHDQWQLGHKNPGSTDSSSDNLILQPPIQAKYKDDYLFFDTLTKMPLPNKLERMLQKKEVTLTQDQIQDYLNLFMKMKTPYAEANDVEAYDPYEGRANAEANDPYEGRANDVEANDPYEGRANVEANDVEANDPYEGRANAEANDETNAEANDPYEGRANYDETNAEANYDETNAETNAEASYAETNAEAYAEVN